jgi:hypothetical protein
LRLKHSLESRAQKWVQKRRVGSAIMVRERTQGSAAPDPIEPNAKSREVRLGLVLYGGVALAIYINGVCAEFFRAVRGRGVYRLIKALTDSDVVVDIVSGTSAGGSTACSWPTHCATSASSPIAP